MPSTAVLSHDIYPHLRVVLGMVIGLGVTRLLSGLARLVQHPGQHRMDAVHLGWVGSTLLALVHFWWWQFGLYQIEAWTFGTYLFVIGYAIALIRNYSDALARSTFRYSILYLTLLFAALFADRLVMS